MRARRPRRPRDHPSSPVRLAGIVLALVGGTALGADPASWQRQVLLAATADEYLVLEMEGRNPGEPDVWTETVRAVRFDGTSNERLAAELIRVEVWTSDASGTKRVERSRSTPSDLAALLDGFGGRLAGPPTWLPRPFLADEDGVYLLENGERLDVITRLEITARADRETSQGLFGDPVVAGMQVIGEQYFLTLRANRADRRREIVMKILR